MTLFRDDKAKWIQCVLFCLLSVLAYSLIGYRFIRTQSGELILSFGTLFLIYGLIISRKWDELWVRRWLWIALGFRLLFLLAIPVLSDDYFRFIWDGRLVAAGYNPYLYLPSALVGSSIAADAQLDKVLFEGMNSPHYFTVYPPLNQLIFGLAARLAGGNTLVAVVLLRSFIVLSEIGIFWMIMHPAKSINSIINKKKGSQFVLVYALNPLIIVELTGNLHFEAVTLFFVLLALRWIDRPFQGDKYYLASAVALGLGVAIKLLPLLFLPLFIKCLRIKKGLIYSAVTGSVLLILFLPFLSLELFLNFGKSLDLYFQKFEFNASFYYLLRELGYWLTGYNIIQLLGPFLSLITLTSIIWIALQRRSFLEKMLFSLTVYFLLATTVHPWYITTLVAFGALTGYWYPVMWSALLPLTYVAYSTIPYYENLRMVALEYILVLGCLCYEVFLKGLDWEAS